MTRRSFKVNLVFSAAFMTAVVSTYFLKELELVDEFYFQLEIVLVAWCVLIRVIAPYVFTKLRPYLPADSEEHIAKNPFSQFFFIED